MSSEAGAYSGTYPLPMPVGRRRMVLLAEGSFSPLGAKTAACLARFVPDEVVAVVDSKQAPGTVQSVLGYGGQIPVVGTLQQSLALRPNVAVLGTAPKGGMMTDAERRQVVEAIRLGLHVVSGMHQFLGDDVELVTMAAAKGVVLWDARRPPSGLDVSSGKECPYCPVVLTVGSDCNTGKMTCAVELQRCLVRNGIRAGFAASGQTGIMIAGKGIPVDRVVADFIGGATERLVLETAPGMDVVILEGQGSLLHPGYAGVTAGMLSGALPHGMILCHQPTRKVIRNYAVPIPSLSLLVEIYENAIIGIKKVPVLGVALNTFDLDEEAARSAVESAGAETGLAVADPIRFGAGELVAAIARLLPGAGGQ